MNSDPRIIIIAGPTASGKTSLSVQLAAKLQGEIVNADSMQVYRGMDVGTAKPTLEERNGVPHHLMDVVDPDEAFNAAIYRSLALPLIKAIRARGNHCLVVGGTGLYIKSLMGGLSDCPPSDPQLREALRRECDAKGPASLHERLGGIDSEAAAKIHSNDRVRIVRALEIFSLTGRRPSELNQEHRFRDRPFKAIKFCLNVERDRLYRRINERSEYMIRSGLMEETEALLSKGYSSELKPMQALGYRHMLRRLRGECSLDEALDQLKRDTRRYAKRQLTWFRADPEMIWAPPEKVDDIYKKIRRFTSESST